MKLALSTNWFRDPGMPGEEIAERAGSLGFDAVELGFSTTSFQAEGFRRRIGEMPVCSVHAFCPVPVSAPQGYPELYALASPDADQRAIARFHVEKNLRFAASLGAGAVVLHAGRVALGSFWRRDAGTAALSAVLDKCSRDTSSPAYSKALAKALSLRRKRGAELMDGFKKEIDLLLPAMRETGVALALENLPYLEGFPDEDETARLCADFAGSPLKAWFDTGHHRVREMHRWTQGIPQDASMFAGMHLNDVVDFEDDHLAPGGGKVDFAALKPLAQAIGRIVFEPKSRVDENALRRGLALIRGLWRE